LTPPPVVSAPPDSSDASSDIPVDRSPLETLVARGWSDAPLDLIGAMAGLQIMMVVVGAAFLIRRSTRP
jgi:hypothetical protein